MFGDIITDLGAAVAGGMGIAASGNLNPRFDRDDPTSGGPSMFEPVHGSSPDIAGQNKANPLATLDTLAMLLNETGKLQQDRAMQEVGRRVAEAVQRITPEFAGKPLDRSGLSTDAIGEMAVEALKAAATD
jgi:3-isopropylmalate dehydrogenase